MPVQQGIFTDIDKAGACAGIKGVPVAPQGYRFGIGANVRCDQNIIEDGIAEAHGAGIEPADHAAGKAGFGDDGAPVVAGGDGGKNVLIAEVHFTHDAACPGACLYRSADGAVGDGYIIAKADETARRTAVRPDGHILGDVEIIKGELFDAGRGAYPAADILLTLDGAVAHDAAAEGRVDVGIGIGPNDAYHAAEAHRVRSNILCYVAADGTADDIDILVGVAVAAVIAAHNAACHGPAVDNAVLHGGVIAVDGGRLAGDPAGGGCGGGDRYIFDPPVCVIREHSAGHALDPVEAADAGIAGHAAVYHLRTGGSLAKAIAHQPADTSAAGHIYIFEGIIAGIAAVCVLLAADAADIGGEGHIYLYIGGGDIADGMAGQAHQPAAVIAGGSARFFAVIGDVDVLHRYAVDNTGGGGDKADIAVIVVPDRHIHPIQHNIADAGGGGDGAGHGANHRSILVVILHASESEVGKLQRNLGHPRDAVLAARVDEVFEAAAFLILPHQAVEYQLGIVGALSAEIHPAGDTDVFFGLAVLTDYGIPFGQITDLPPCTVEVAV